MRPLRTRILMALAAAGFAGCGGGVPAAQTPAPADSPDEGVLPSGHPTVEARSLTEIEADAMARTGTVQEILAGGGYTYARVKVGEGEMWIAGPQTPLEVGQEVGVAGAMPMGPFSSPSLERSFENLYFVGGFQPAGPPPGADRGEVLELLEGGGYTYVRARHGEEEIWLAGPATVMAVGDSVLWSGGMDMGEFYSRSLDRTFPGILFVGQFWVEGR